MADYVKDIILICAAAAVAVSLVPKNDHGAGRSVRFLSSVLIITCAVSPLSSALSKLQRAPDVDLPGVYIIPEAEEVPEGSYEDSVLKKTAGIISDYVKRTLSEKYGIEGASVSVCFETAEEGTVNIADVQIFTGVRIDSYLDREAEDYLSESLGCEVHIFSE